MSTVNWIVFLLILLGALSLFFILRESGKTAPLRKPETSKSLADFSFETSEALANEPFPQQGQMTHWPTGELTFDSSILTAVARNPFSLYVYWEFVNRDANLKKLVNTYGPGAFPILRIYELTEHFFAATNVHSFFDVPIDPDANNWYVEVPHSATYYCVELGIVLPGTNYISLLRSREVSTPRNTLSPRIDPDWLPLPGLQFGFGSPAETLTSVSLVKEKLERMI